MVGDNIKKHPDEYRMVVEHGHRIGNHTFNHIRGFEYSNPDYLANAQKVDEIIHSDLFRPPHGLIAPWANKIIAFMSVNSFYIPEWYVRVPDTVHR